MTETIFAHNIEQINVFEGPMEYSLPTVPSKPLAYEPCNDVDHTHAQPEGFSHRLPIALVDSRLPKRATGGFLEFAANSSGCPIEDTSVVVSFPGRFVRGRWVVLEVKLQGGLVSQRRLPLLLC